MIETMKYRLMKTWKHEHRARICMKKSVIDEFCWTKFSYQQQKTNENDYDDDDIETHIKRKEKKKKLQFANRKSFRFQFFLLSFRFVFFLFILLFFCWHFCSSFLNYSFFGLCLRKINSVYIENEKRQLIWIQYLEVLFLGQRNAKRAAFYFGFFVVVVIVALVKCEIRNNWFVQCCQTLK